METKLSAKQRTAPLPLRPAWFGGCRCNARRLVLLLFALWVPIAAADSYSEILAKHLELTQGDEVDLAPASTPDHNGLVMSLAALALALGIIVPRVRGRLVSLRAVASDPSEALLPEEPALGAFFSELRDGLTAPAPAPVVDVDPLQVFFDSAPGQLASLRTLFSEISRAADEAARKKILLEFLDQVRRLKEGSQMLELRPVWVVACALEGLLKQLSNNASNVTASVLGTAAGSVDLLEALCVRGLNPNLASDPPVRILAVDDDPVSRLAISFALKKAFNEPNLAPEGESALALAMQQAYDVIFLDVEMPGMDGFELCTRIHGTVLNRTTPVVFVTRHSDFGSRAKSSLSGGRDLIAKPFLAFEITLKALTLALRARLVGEAEPVPANKELSGGTTPVKAVDTSEAPAAIPRSVQSAPVATPSREVLGERNAEETEQELSGRNFPAFPKLSQNGAEAFFTQVPAHFKELRNRLDAARHASGPTDLQKFLGELYMGVHSLSSEAERAEYRAISKLGLALEGMLKKLMEHAKLCAPSTLAAAGAALELLEELCQEELNPDLANPPIRLLVVDDDPVARRAISGSLQLAFGRPETADSGEAALTLATETPFDLIFLDVLMPGMDGFTACTKIHETAANRRTPIVFVTSRDNLDSRSQAAAAGGCGFIPKPVLASQITLTALTFILRARLNRIEPALPPEEVACLANA